MSDSRLDKEFLQAAFGVAVKAGVEHALVISDLALAPEDLRRRGLKDKLIHATTLDAILKEERARGIKALLIPAYALVRMERIKFALAAAINAGLLKDKERVICLTGRDLRRPPDTAMLITIGAEFEEHTTLKLLSRDAGIAFQLVDAVLNLATQVGFEGFEGHPVGTIIVVGDAVAVMEKSRQLALNPFQGYSEAERSIFDQHIRDAVKNFAVMDGAFIIREDGVVITAGRYLVTGDLKIDLPMGLGARHAAAAAISKETKAIAVAVSQSTGCVRVFQAGQIVLEIQQASRRA